MSHSLHHLARSIAETQYLQEQIDLYPAQEQAKLNEIQDKQEELADLRITFEQMVKRGDQLIGEQVVGAELLLPEGMTVQDALANNHEGIADEVAVQLEALRQQ